MNIFFLHQVPQIAALYHCDKHVVKMIVETAQLLSTAHHVWDPETTVKYKPTHVNHPSNKWVRSSRLHYDYAATLGHSLCKEYRRRYNKNHVCESMFSHELYAAPKQMFSLPLLWQDPPQCMPDECKRESSIEGYREYYRYKRNIMSMVWYRGTENYEPEFMKDTNFVS